MIFFTSDTHFFHYKLIEIGMRPFENVCEMNNTIVNNWNKKVGTEDIVHHLGDFALTWKKKLIHELVSALNGKIKLIKADHDKPIGKEFSDKIEITDKIVEIKLGNHPLVLCHYPITFWPKSHYNSWHIHGHTHGRYVHHGKSYDVGVDNTNFNVISEEELKNILRNKPDNINKLNKNKK